MYVIKIIAVNQVFTAFISVFNSTGFGNERMPTSLNPTVQLWEIWALTCLVAATMLVYYRVVSDSHKLQDLAREQNYILTTQVTLL